ncbi:MAG: polyphenol oxidase family protein [Candidatus Hydrogenedentes bacterium]|nr:polyphenol oxidase family protein [Candidatus Hydrogenedentota bacterium]
MKRFTWLEEHGAAVAFMTGVADGDCGWEGCVSGSRDTFLRGAPIPSDKLVVLRQCHGKVVHAVRPQDAGKGALSRESALGDGDGLITACPGIPLGINVADCVPVFLCGGGVVGLIHAGRAGTELNIAGHAVDRIVQEFGVPAASLFALIGPSAGPCCYQVGKEALQKSAEAGLVVAGDRLDLWETNRNQLRASGVPDAHVSVDGCCTICHPGYFSYRGRGTAERNLGVIMG